jgi:hypothetical protein
MQDDRTETDPEVRPSIDRWLRIAEEVVAHPAAPPEDSSS